MKQEFSSCLDFPHFVVLNKLVGTDLRLPGRLNYTPDDNFHEIFTVDSTHALTIQKSQDPKRVAHSSQGLKKIRVH